MKWPWHLLARVKRLSCKRLRRTRIETLLESDWMQVVVLPEGARKWEEIEKDKSHILSDREPQRAEELRCEATSALLRLISGSALIGLMWFERGRFSISYSHTTACLSVNLCLPPRLTSPPHFYLYVLSLSVAEESHTSFIQILSICVCFAHLWYIAGPACRMTQRLFIL